MPKNLFRVSGRVTSRLSPPEAKNALGRLKIHLTQRTARPPSLLDSFLEAHEQRKDTTNPEFLGQIGSSEHSRRPTSLFLSSSPSHHVQQQQGMDLKLGSNFAVRTTQRSMPVNERSVVQGTSLLFIFPVALSILPMFTFCGDRIPSIQIIFPLSLSAFFTTQEFKQHLLIAQILCSWRRCSFLPPHT